MNIIEYYFIFTITSLLFCSCTREIVPVQHDDNDECIPVASLKLGRKKMSVIIPALRTRVDTRRREFNLDRFCAYREKTSNGKFQILTVFQRGVNHVSENWILLSDKQAVDTKLNGYLMVTDSIVMQQLITTSVSQLIGADEASKHELIQMLTNESRSYRKRGLILGTQKPPMP